MPRRCTRGSVEERHTTPQQGPEDHPLALPPVHPCLKLSRHPSEKTCGVWSFRPPRDRKTSHCSRTFDEQPCDALLMWDDDWVLNFGGHSGCQTTGSGAVLVVLRAAQECGALGGGEMF